MEKYGTIPPKFTKEWWSYFWTYYKIHTIAAAVVVILILYTVHACVSTVNYDLTVYMLAQNEHPATVSMKNLEKKLSSLSSDVTGNGKVETTINVDVFASNPNNLYMEFANEATQTTKFIAEATNADNQIYIVDAKTADILVSYNCMLPISEWADDVSDQNLYNDYFLSLADNPAFNSWGFDTENMYIGVLIPGEDASDYKLKMQMYENAKKVANQLIKE